MVSKKLCSITPSYFVLPLIGFAEISIANRINEHKCYKNVLRNHSAPHDQKALNRSVYICKGATSSVPSSCYEKILRGFKSFPNEQTLERLASVCTAKNLINGGQLAIKPTEKPPKVDAVSLN